MWSLTTKKHKQLPEAQSLEQVCRLSSLINICFWFETVFKWTCYWSYLTLPNSFVMFSYIFTLIHFKPIGPNYYCYLKNELANYVNTPRFYKKLLSKTPMKNHVGNESRKTLAAILWANRSSLLSSEHLVSFLVTWVIHMANVLAIQY